MSKQNKKKSSFLQNISVPLISIFLTLIVAAIILLIMGKNPLTAFVSFLRGSGLVARPQYAGGQGQLTDLFSFLAIMTPMIFASLGIMVALRTGLFNIGVAGQMLAAAFVATITVGYSDLPAGIAMPLVILVGIVVGGTVGAFIGFIKYRFNVHEVVSSIMLNYIILYVTGFFINSYFVDPISRNSKPVKDAARLVVSGKFERGGGIVRYEFPLGLILAFVVVYFMWFILERTVTGFRMKAVGKNKYCARFAGINVGNNMVLAMLLSGALAGLAGVTYYLGFTYEMVPKQMAAIGFDSIAVAVLGNIAPLGCLFASFLVTIFQKGSVYMSSTMSVPAEIASVITGVLLLFSASGAYISEKVSSFAHRNTAVEHDANALPEEGPAEIAVAAKTEKLSEAEVEELVKTGTKAMSEKELDDIVAATRARTTSVEEDRELVTTESADEEVQS